MQASELVPYAIIAGVVGHLLLRVDEWIHSPASLKKDIEDIKRRLDAGSGRFSDKMSEVTVVVNDFRERISRLEGIEDERHTPRPKSK